MVGSVGDDRSLLVIGLIGRASSYEFVRARISPRVGSVDQASVVATERSSVEVETSDRICLQLRYLERGVGDIGV